MAKEKPKIKFGIVKEIVKYVINVLILNEMVQCWALDDWMQKEINYSLGEQASSHERGQSM